MNSRILPKRSTEKPKSKLFPTEHAALLNHLNQRFHPFFPNYVWASDFNYIKVNGSFHYLCVVMELFSRKIHCWSISNRNDVNLTKADFQKAYID